MRRTLDVTIEADNRDKGKVYHLEEMDAWRATNWADRAINVVVRNGLDLESIGAHVEMGSMEVLLKIGVNKLFAAPYNEISPLIDEMMLCVKIKPSPSAIRHIMDGDVEEIATIFKLRWEVILLHVGFSLGGAQSKDSTSTSPPPPPPRSHTPTSTKSSEASLPAGRRR